MEETMNQSTSSSMSLSCLIVQVMGAPVPKTSHAPTVHAVDLFMEQK
jgi:hypothetical protein